MLRWFPPVCTSLGPRSVPVFVPVLPGTWLPLRVLSSSPAALWAEPCRSALEPGFVVVVVAAAAVVAAVVVVDVAVLVEVAALGRLRCSRLLPESLPLFDPLLG